MGHINIKDIVTLNIIGRAVIYALTNKTAYLISISEKNKATTGLTESTPISALPNPHEHLSDLEFECLCRDVIKWQSNHFLENKLQKKSPYIPPSGKVLDNHDLSQLIDASLDMWLTTGRFNTKFETALSHFIGTKFAISVNSGSSANLLAITALSSPSLGNRQLKKGDEVLTLAAAFPTTVVPIIQNNFVPVFIDIESKTANVDVSQLEAALSEKTKAIFIAHTLGNPYNLSAIKTFANTHNLWLIEDNCDALGATYNGKRTGSFGDISTLSFYPAHHITTGEGGAVLTSNALLKKIMLSIRDWGRDCWCEPGESNTCSKRFKFQLGSLPTGYDHKYTYSHMGYNLKMTDWQAAIGLSQLEKASDFIHLRQKNYTWLQKILSSFPYLHITTSTKNATPSWFGLLITIDQNAPFTRLKLIEYLEENNIGTRLLFSGNLLRQPFVSTHDFPLRIGKSPIYRSKELTEKHIQKLPITEKYMNHSFWIGVWPGIKESERQTIANTFSSFFEAQ